MPAMSRKPTKLTAVLRGSRFPKEPFGFVIHSIFNSAINIYRNNDKLLLSYVLKKAAMHPRAVLVIADGQELVDFSKLNLMPSMRGFTDANGFHIQSELLVQYASDITTLPSARISIELTHGQGKWKRLGANCAATLSAFQKQKNTDLNIQTLFGGGAEGSAHDSSSADIRLRTLLINLIQNLGRAMQQYHVESALQYASKLIGLGHGLTPAGDDFLSGFNYALMCQLGSAEDTRSFANREFLDGLNTLLQNKPYLTNDISRTFLLLSLAGEASEALKHLALVFSTGFSQQQFELALQGLSNIGHSSGLDMACGFIYGLFLNDGAFLTSQPTLERAQPYRL